MADDQDIQIAVLQEQIKGVKEQQKANADTTKELFVAQSLDFAKKFEDQNKMIAVLSSQMTTLNAALNRGRGAYAASMALASIIGGGIMAIIEWIRH